jgi:signal transduction histidine kinase
MDDVLLRLQSGRAYERLAAARHLARTHDVTYAEPIRRALRGETDRWVRTALEEALERLTAGEPRRPPALAPLDEDKLVQDISAQIAEEITSQLLHEIRPIVGRLKYQAAKEVPGYEGSRTAKEVRQIEGFLHAMEALNQASSAPRYEDFDLAELIADLATSVDSQMVRRIGPAPLLISSDRSLLALAVENGLRNAVEATVEKGAPATITAAWGDTDKDYWVSVLDEGVGLPVGMDRIFEIGISTKSKSRHAGMGLAIAQRAIASLGGTISLVPREGGGAAFEVRWPHQRE